MKFGWIQVGTKLPQEGQQVLVWDSLLNHIGLSKYLKGEWCCDDQEHFTHPGVTHWMPVPNNPLYKKEK